MQDNNPKILMILKSFLRGVDNPYGTYNEEYLDYSKPNGNLEVHVQTICQYVATTDGLTAKQSEGSIKIFQKTDDKSIAVRVADIEEVISRVDSDGQNFLQVNFLNGLKILLTTKLIGFKPARFPGLDMDKLPKVVTTPDLISVVEAIEENLSNEENQAMEAEILRKVFDSVLAGGEAVGFDLQEERAWLNRLSSSKSKFSA